MSRGTRLAIATGAASALGALAVATARTRRGVGEQLGGVPDGARLARMQRSAQWRDGRFHNRDRSVGVEPGPVTAAASGSGSAAASGSGSAAASGPASAATAVGPAAATGGAAARDAARRFLTDRARREPPAPVPVHDDALRLDEQGVQFGWLGHASVLLSLGGERILFDPVWSDRCSPSAHVGPRRMHRVPFALSDLDGLAAVVISHDHYDHLDMATIQALCGLQDCPFVVPLGIGAHLERWGVPESRIVELDWGESTTVGSVELTAVSSQHFSGRGIRRNPTLWASWVAASPAGSVYFSGDTGYFDGFAGIGREHGPFDAAFMAVGMYDPAWRSVHLDPEEAVLAAAELGARLAVPIHWCTFALAPHAWSEPPERFVAAAEQASVAYVIPEVGEAVDARAPGAGSPWWRVESGAETRDRARVPAGG